ncbi:hypothetical protein [Oceanobacter mangrovi]|uniref:hypothetical protein n=1 Tax=Oceanobacter mangrovi TaxID=2862510 RepID=UPI001C8F0DE9|nr:hypothetical protein [Oceanobacter mangrovi]
MNIVSVSGPNLREPVFRVLFTFIITLCSAIVIAGACSTAGVTGAVMGVFDGGSVEINDGSASSWKESDDLCNVTFSGGANVNVLSDDYYGSSKSDCGIEPSDTTIDRLDLPDYESTDSTKTLKVKNSTTYIYIDGTKYQQRSSKWCIGSSDCGYTQVDAVQFPDLSTGTVDYVTLTNSDWASISLETDSQALYLSYSSSQDSYHIGELSIANGGTLIMEPGTYFIDSLEVDSSYLVVKTKDQDGNALGDGSGQVKLYIKDQDDSGNKIFNNGACINFENCDISDGSIDTSGQYPERLAIFVYDGDLVLYDRAKIAASLYADSGDIIIRSNSGFAFVGEMLGENISVINNSGVDFVYQDTGTFAELYSSASSGRDGEFSLAGSAVADNVSTGDYVYIPSQTDNTDESGITGHLKAFAIQSDGETSSTASWDANSLMTADDRRTKLWSTDTDGNLVLLTALDDDAFAVSSTLSTDTIIEYTIDPSYGSGAYLGDRDSSSMMGAPYISQPVVMGDIVVFQTDDGFVYAVDSQSGALKWGFIPRPLVASLQLYDSFYSSHPMAGQIAVLNEDGAETAGFIVGSALSGSLHYALEVDGSGDLEQLLWVDERTSSNAHRPILMYVGSTPTATYIGDTSEIVARSLEQDYDEDSWDVANTLEDSDSSLVAEPIAVVEYVLDSSGNARVQEAELYAGDNAGYVYQTTLVSNSKFKTTVKLETLGNIGTNSNVSDPVLYLEHATETDAEYLTAQSTTRLKTFRIPSDDDEWLPDWTSYAGGSGYWDDSGSSYTSETTFTPNTEHIQKLPSSGATITDKLTIAASVVFLPVQVETTSSCDAYYYLYQLSDGYFPSNTIYSSSVVTDNVKVGTGAAYQANVMVLNGDVVVQGNSQNNTDSLLGIDDAFTFTSSPGGRSGWREVKDE